MTKEIILGSSSYIRKKIMKEMGYEFSVMTADLNERALGTRNSDKDAPALVSLLAKAKADEILRRVTTMCSDDKERHSALPELLLTADSVATFEGNILEKPNDLSQAEYFLTRYGTGNPLSIVTGMCVTNLKSGTQFQGIDASTVYFNPFSHSAIATLLEEGTVLKCAGGIIIEHELVQPFIRNIDGSIDGIQGLPKHLVEQLIAEAMESK